MTLARNKPIQKSNTKPRAMLEEQVMVTMAQTLSDFAVQMSDIIKEYGITMVHYNVLRILRGAGANGIPCGTVAERMVNKEPDITRLLDRMEKLELIVRARDQSDRRVVITQITEHGLTILEKLEAPLKAMRQQQFEGVSSEKLEQLLGIIQEIQAVQAG